MASAGISTRTNDINLRTAFGFRRHVNGTNGIYPRKGRKQAARSVSMARRNSYCGAKYPIRGAGCCRSISFC